MPVITMSNLAHERLHRIRTKLNRTKFTKGKNSSKIGNKEGTQGERGAITSLQRLLTPLK